MGIPRQGSTTVIGRTPVRLECACRRGDRRAIRPPGWPAAAPADA
ncbi:hypothetical protein CSB85_2800 [Pseudomonas aeruginosa]|nr:hypothetical protein CSB85_2800 [Pseudomonas aeruginosa]